MRWYNKVIRRLLPRPIYKVSLGRDSLGRPMYLEKDGTVSYEPPVSTLRRRLLHARHNLIAHPVAGVLWLFGFERAGDWVHDTF